MRKLSGYDFQLEPSAIRKKRGKLVDMLNCLLEAALQSQDPSRALRDIVVQSVRPNGIVEPAQFHLTQDRIFLNDEAYAGPRELAEEAAAMFDLAADHEQHETRVRLLRQATPLLSTTAIELFSCLFLRPPLDLPITSEGSPIALHAHWGARHMAGYPPRKHGYFSQKSTKKIIRTWARTISERLGAIQPIYLLLAPASVFMLCPSSANPNDTEILSVLFRKLGSQSPHIRTSDQIEAIVDEWWSGARRHISSYFKARFSGSSHYFAQAEAGWTVEPEGFPSLSVRDACTVVGALIELCSRDHKS
jgi:hypothetical protein